MVYSYSVGPHPVSSIHIYIFVVSRAFMAGAASADSSRAPGLTSGLQGSVNVHRGALLLVHSDGASVLLYFTLVKLKTKTMSTKVKMINSHFDIPLS